LIGFVDDMDLFNLQVNKLLGVKIKIPHENKAMISNQKKSNLVTPELRKQIEVLCSKDIELYNYAKKLV